MYFTKKSIMSAILASIIYCVILLKAETQTLFNFITVMITCVAIPFLADNDMSLQANRLDKKYKISNITICILIVLSELIMIGTFKFTNALLLVFDFVIIALMLFNIPLWWENMRKTLFMNKIVNPFETDFLINFGIKNEILKFFGKLREIDKSRHKKWIAFMCVIPIAITTLRLCYLTGLIVYFVNAELFILMCKIQLVLQIFILAFFYVFSIKSTIKFYKPKRK